MKLMIRELREEMHLTQSELAQKLSTSQRNVSNYETGTSEPDLAMIVRLADIFGVSLDELFGREGHMLEADKLEGLDRLLVKKCANSPMSRKPRCCLFSKDLSESITSELKKECLKSIPFFDDNLLPHKCFCA